MNQVITQPKKNSQTVFPLFFFVFFALVFALTVFSPHFVNAQGTNFSSPSDVSRVIGRIATFMSTLLLASSVIVILAAGFIYLTAGGDETKVTTATKTLTYAVIGIVVGLVAYSIPTLIQAILG